MKPTPGIFVFSIAMLVLSACSDPVVDRLNRAQPVGSPYTKYLAHEYAVLANAYSGSRAALMARKGLAAVDGVITDPVPIDDSILRVPEAAELIAARAALMESLSGGGRDRAPDQSAIAQTRFDCWALKLGFFPGDGVSCQERFQVALDALKLGVAAAPPPADLPPPSNYNSNAAGGFGAPGFPAPITDGARGAMVPLAQASFLTFFDWDRYDISDSAAAVLDTVAAEIKGRNDIRTVVVTGHTDTSGGETYNHKLSLKRAEAVRQALVARGVPASSLRVEGRGETDLRIQTRDNVREAQNRRAQITFE
jgi:OOP family OmpA-OmpF porin